MAEQDIVRECALCGEVLSVEEEIFCTVCRHGLTDSRAMLHRERWRPVIDLPPGDLL